jgi:hypothetical protein
MQPYQPGDAATRPAVDVRRLWSGGLATALVAALVAVVGVVIARGILDIPVLAPEGSGTFGDASTGGLAIAAAAAALVATALIHLLLLSTPRPFAFFDWIVGLVTVLAAFFPFSFDAELDAKLATAVINVLIGIAIGSLTSGVARRSLRRRG